MADLELPQRPKLRITITATIEYEANPAHYARVGADTPEKMLAYDLKDARTDFLEVIEQAHIDGTLAIGATGEVLGTQATGGA
jgi:hypothetical protein